MNSQFFFVRVIPNRLSKAAASASVAHFSEFVSPCRTIWNFGAEVRILAVETIGKHDIEKNIFS